MFDSLKASHNMTGLYYLFFVFPFFLVIHQIGSIISSLASMGWAMASYNRSIRLAQFDKEIISIQGNICQFLWHFCVTGMFSKK